MRNLQTAINQFNLEYGCLPIARATAERCRDIGTDVTFGIPFSLQLPHVAAGNAELMNLLMAREAGPRRELRNPRRIKFMDLMMARSTNDSGLGPDGCYRDPWGNSYVISLDQDGDGYCADAVYSRPEMAIDAMPGTPFDSEMETKIASDRVLWQTRTLIWSRGPDGEADSKTPAKEGVNADNILSWERER